MLDNIIIIAYLIITLTIGLFYRTKSTTLSGYNKVGRDIKKNKLILTATIFASAVGGGTTFGITEKAFSNNLAYAYGLMLTAPIDLLIALVIVPRIVKFSGVVSLGKIMEKYYGTTGRIITGIAATLMSTGYLAAQISVSGRIFSFMLGMGQVEGVIISFLIVTIYTSIGGLRAVVVNNLLQFMAMIAAIPLLFYLGVKYLGFHDFLSNIPAHKYDLTEPDIFKETVYATLSFCVMGFTPSFIQRTLINKEAAPVRSAIFYKTAVYAVFIVFLSFNGLIAAQIIPDAPVTSSLTTMIDILSPAGIKGIIIVGLLAAVMSTADSDLNIASISLVNDVLKPSVNLRDQSALLLINQVLTVIIGSLAIIMSLKFQSVVDLVIFAAGFWSPMIAVPLIGILFNKIIAPQAFIITTAIGGLTFVTAEIFSTHFIGISGVFVGTLASLICFYIATKIAPNKFLPASA